ncbi:hypothetical protein ZQ37_001673 [Salmonella enterica subsp. enterica]|nr:hypothetical protein [Salmonella enterica subsp. enterica serovar Agbeni]
MNKLLTQPLPVSMDLFQLADVSAAFAVELVECTDIVKCMALCGRLSHALIAIRFACESDLQPELIERLTVDDIPAPCVPDCWRDSYVLVGYAQSLTQALLSCTLPHAATVELIGLLHDLVLMMADYLKQPYLEREVMA